MDAGTVLTVVQTLINVLDSRSLQDFATASGVEKKINKLRSTLSTINAVRLDANESGVLSHVEQNWLHKLQVVAYEAEDVVDAFNTLSHQQKGSHIKLLKKVRYFFSLMGMSKEMNKITEQLADIAKERQNYSNTHPSVVREQLMPVRRKDTPSFGADEDAVGRDHDKKKVIDMLLDSNIHATENLSCVSIVGIGGMGKTTLAQLVYNDERFKSEFTRLWVCVPEDFDLKSLITGILLSATNKKPENLGIDQLQDQLRKEIGGKRILLVLDDVWNENRNKWLEFKRLLVGVERRSKVLVTTRSKKVAIVTGEYPIYELQGLSEEDSWCLFEKMAFGHDQVQSTVNVELVELGKEIVKTCANVPLAIRTIGSLLYGQDKSKWISFKNNDLASLKQDDEDILPTLKLSYWHLPAVMRRCFCYCAIFPKGGNIEKDFLINLWLAEGYISSTHNDDAEDIAKECFETLLERCFFQNIQRGKWGEIRSFKIHDLLHTLAMNIAQSEGLPFTMQQSIINFKKLRCLSIELTPNEFKKCIALYSGSNSRLSLPSVCPCLRVLDLRYYATMSILSQLDKLIHLRYLDLSQNSFRNLPESITKLWNLQTLRLKFCGLKRLPRKFHRLVNLKHLDITGCSELEYMPPHLDALTRLRTISTFIVCNSNDVGHLQDLKGLKHLRGELAIEIPDGSCCLEKTMGADLKSKQHLTGLSLMFNGVNIQDRQRDETLLEDLQPPMNVRVLSIDGYRGKSLPSWLPLNNLESVLRNLVDISLLDSIELNCLPSLSKLSYLKRLKLSRMNILYIENRSGSSMSTPYSTLFFPSLEFLQLDRLHDLKGWFKPGGTLDDNGDEDDEEVHSLSSFLFFPRLSQLRITNCSSLVSMPLCPFVVDLHLSKINDRLWILEKMAMDLVTTSGTTSQPNFSALKELIIDNASRLISLPEGSLRGLSSLSIYEDCGLQNLSTIGEAVFQRLTSLHSLEIELCNKLKTLKAGGLQHLIALETLRIAGCPELEVKDEDEDDSILPWKPLGSRLHSLSFSYLPMVENLPKGWQYFSSLQSLEILNVGLTALPKWIGDLKSLQYLRISSCDRLTSLPESMRDLTSLNELRISWCHGLTKRCREPDGEDWPKIRHIPDIRIV